jgi:penicillin-binding protein 2
MVALIVFCMLPLTLHAQGTQGTPREVVAAFLEAWNAQDLTRMYSLLSPQSQEFFAQQVFDLRYQLTHETMAFEGVTYTLGDERIQGVTAAVKYDVVVTSGAFGEIVDTGRTMRLVENNGIWGIAWSSMDIFDALTADSTIAAVGRLPTRANVYDRNGQPVAGPGTVIALYVNRQSMGNEEACIGLMTRITRRPSSSFRSLISQYNPESNFFLEELNGDILEANRGEIESYCGIQFTNERSTRTYYGNNAGAHAIGFIGPITAEQEAQYRRRGYNSTDLVGQNGVERVFESNLAGQPARVLRIVEPGGTVLRELGSSEGAPSAPVQMTIDRDLQVAVAQALADAYEYAQPNWGGVAGAGAAVVLDVNTGAVLALASFPPIDPHLFDRESENPGRQSLLGIVVGDPREPLANHVTQNQYSPGSVFKIITAGAVLNEGLIRPDETFMCDLYWDGRPFGDTQERRQDWRVVDEMPAAGEITPAQAIMSSCNPFFWQYGALLFREVSRDTLAEYSQRMGLGQQYGLFPGAPEATGLLPVPPNTPTAINESVGQGDISIPPIGMAVVTAAIANGGTVYKPYIVQQIGGFDDTDIIQRIDPQVLNELDFNPGVIETIQEGMCGVISDQNLGTAYIRFDNAPYTLCGKTGTAQTAQYPNAWFVAYAPADNPQVAIAVMVSQSLEGSQIAAPITRRILDYYFSAPEWEPFPDWWAIGPYTPLSNPSAG